MQTVFLTQPGTATADRLCRLGRELKIKSLGVHDVFHAFNGRRDGLMTCGELAAGLAWLGLPMAEPDLHNFVRGLDRDSDGLISIDEWAQGFPELPETQASRTCSSTQQQWHAVPRIRTHL